MIAIHFIRGRYWPLVLCDACHERITDHQQAHVLWDGMDDPGPVYHVHQGRCHQLIEQQIEAPGGHAYWDRLDTHLSRLANNIGMQHPKAFAEAQAQVKREALVGL
jgi:hypothetical protein